MKFAPIIFIVPCTILLATTSADILENPDFELPPSKWAPNATVPSVPLNENNTIPGWTSSGSVHYVTAGSKHGILLAEDGKINQTFTASGGGGTMQYLLTFALGIGGVNCKTNVSLLVSAPDSASEFSVKHSYGKDDSWVIYGHHLGSWDNGEPINLVLQSQTIDTGDSNSTTCWPLVDKLVLNTNDLSRQAPNKDNLLPNGGFESGPAFLDKSSEGVLLDSEPSLAETAVPDWSVIGTVRYIDSKNYFVPEGNAAVEIVSGVAAGIQTAKTLKEGSDYSLEFMLGDANDSCTGDLTVGVQAGSSLENFTIQSKGTGSALKRSMMFKVVSSPTPISFQSYTLKQSKDGVFCGPVIDGVVLRASDAHAWTKFSVTAFFLVGLLQQLLMPY